MALCKHCGGTGVEPDQSSLSTAMRGKRRALKFTLAEMAAKLKISPQYLHDMERGRRRWSVERVKAVEEISESRFPK